MKATKSTAVLERSAFEPPVRGGVAPGRHGVALDRLRALPALLKPREAFEVIGVSTSTGYEWIQRCLIPVVRVGDRMFVRTVELAETVFGIPPAVLLGDEVDRITTDAG